MSDLHLTLIESWLLSEAIGAESGESTALAAPCSRCSSGEMSMERVYCKGTLVRKRVSYTVTRKGYHLIIDDVPAWVCEQCGEPLFDEETVDIIQEMLRGVDVRLKRLAVPSATV